MYPVNLSVLLRVAKGSKKTRIETHASESRYDALYPVAKVV